MLRVDPILYVLAFLVIFGGAWLIAVVPARGVRFLVGVILLGLVGVLSGLIGGSIGCILQHIDDNVYFSAATEQLIRTSVRALDEGHLDRVKAGWGGLERLYQPTYENRAGYSRLVEEAAARMRGDVPIEPGSAWDPAAFRWETWAGHWEDGTGFWLVIHGNAARPRVCRSGGPPWEITGVTLAADFSEMKCDGGRGGSFTIRLKNRRQAGIEWSDPRAPAGMLDKLVRAGGEEKK